MNDESRCESGVNEVRVARYRDLIERGVYRRPSRDIAERILEQDLTLQSGPMREVVSA